MAYRVKVGSLAQPTSTNASFATTGVGFTPKVLILYATNQTSDTSGTDVMIHRGMATSTTNRVGLSTWILTTTNTTTVRAQDDTKVFLVSNTAGTTLVAADLVSFDTDGFTLNFSTVDSTARKINYICLGGSDLTNAFIKEFKPAASNTAQAFTGVGFKPDAIILMSVANGNIPPSNETASGGYDIQGFATASNQYGMEPGWDNSATSPVEGQISGQLILKTSSGGTTPTMEASLTSMDADGFTVTLSQSTSVKYCFALCLKGGQYKVGAFNQNTSTGNQAVSGTGFNPVGVLFASANYATSSVVNTQSARASEGAMDGTNRFSVWGGQGGSSTWFARNDQDTTKALKLMSEGNATQTVNAAFDFVSFDTSGFTVNNTTTDVTSREIVYMAFGQTTLSPSVFDSSTVTDLPTVEVVYLLPSIFDSSAVTENVATIYVRCPNVSESSTVTDVIVQMLQTYLPNVQESLAVSENIVLLQTKFISVFDSSNVVENFGNALRFNAASATPSTNWSSVTDNFTMIAWIRPTIPQSPSTSIIAYNGDDNGGWGIGILNSSHFIALYGGAGAPGFIDPGLVLVNNQVYHVALVRRSGHTYLYVNGTETDTGVLSAPNTPTASWASVGFQYDSADSPSRFYLGDLDELKVYSRAYSAADITTDYNSGKGTYGYSTDANIVALYHMDEGTGTTASDQVGGDTLNLSITSWIPSFVPGYETVEIVDSTSIFDSSAATDVLTQVLQIYTISVSESSTATDTLIAVYNPPQVSDSSTVTDAIVQILILDFEILNDASAVTDSPSMLITTPGGGVSVLEITTPTESLIVQSGSMWNISVSDTSIATDTPGVLLLTPPQQIGWIDFSTVTESFVVQAGTFFSTFDASQATDVATVAVPLLGPINVFDSPIATENTPYQYIQQESLANPPTTGTIKDNASWQVGGWIQLTPSINNQHGEFEYSGTLPPSFETLFDINVAGQADSIYFYWGCNRTPLNELDNAGGYIFALDEFVSTNTPYLLNFNGTTLSSQGTITWNDGIWHSVRLEVAGTTITAFLDNVQKFSFVDSSRVLGGSLYGWGSRTGGQNAIHSIRNTQVATLAPVKVIETTFFPTIIVDSSAVTDSANVALVQCPTVSETSTVTDVPTLFLPVLTITTFESSTVTDVVILPFQIISIVMPSSVSGEHFGIRVWTP